MSKTNTEYKEKFLEIFGDEKHYYPIRKSCKKANIGKSTFYRWMQDSEFENKIEEIKTKRKDDPTSFLKRESPSAIIKFLHRYARNRGY